MTNILLEMGDIFQAERAIESNEIICSSLDYSEGIVNSIRLRGIIELHKDNLGLAQEYLERARKMSEENKYVETQIQSELSLADLYLRRLKIRFNEGLQKTAKECLLRASRLAETTALEPGKLEAQLLEAVAHSIEFEFEKAMAIVGEVESKANSLGLHLVEEKARNIRTQLYKDAPGKDLSDEEMLGYIARAQKYIEEAQVAFTGI
jgi:hypothetical protein